jgi:hypothetical protein
MQTFDFAGCKADMMAQELGSLPFQFKCVQYGLNHAPQAIYDDVV